MIPNTHASALLDGLAGDPKNSAQLRARAKEDPEGTLRMAAQQFETLVLDMVLKGMRKSVSENSLFDSEATKLYTDLLDQEMSKKLSTSGQFGLADLMVKQLTQLNGPVQKDAVKPIQ